MNQEYGTPVESRRVLSAGTMMGNRVRNKAGEDLGKIEDIVLDVDSGDIAYAVLSFGGFLGLGDKLFAVPFRALTLDANSAFELDVDKATLESAPGFVRGDWPDFANPAFETSVYEHYKTQPYWESPGYMAAVRKPVFSGTAASTDAQVERERLEQPDLPVELRRRPVDVMNFPGRDADADLKTADPSRSYSVTDSDSWTRKTNQ